MKSFFTLVFYFAVLGAITAQAPQAFNYQGVARDNAGVPLSNQNISLEIALLEGSPTGVEVYKETHQVSTGATGVFSLQVGTGAAINGNFTDIDWGVADHYLQLGLDATGGSNYQIMGTSQLLSVPYALYAENGFDEYVYGVHGASEGNYNTAFELVTEDSTKACYIDFITSGGDRDARVIWNHPNNNQLLGVFVGENGVTQRGFYLNDAGNMVLGGSFSYPHAKLQVEDGDVYITNINKGVIMKSPNGQCWRYTPDNTGQLVATPVVCPN